MAIDEFGFDYGGQTDEKAARILREDENAVGRSLPWPYGRCAVPCRRFSATHIGTWPTW